MRIHKKNESPRKEALEDKKMRWIIDQTKCKKIPWNKELKAKHKQLIELNSKIQCNEIEKRKYKKKKKTTDEKRTNRKSTNIHFSNGRKLQKVNKS